MKAFCLTVLVCVAAAGCSKPSTPPEAVALPTEPDAFPTVRVYWKADAKRRIPVAMEVIELMRVGPHGFETPPSDVPHPKLPGVRNPFGNTAFVWFEPGKKVRHISNIYNPSTGATVCLFQAMEGEYLGHVAHQYQHLILLEEK